jgi:hypothetical protein
MPTRLTWTILTIFSVFYHVAPADGGFRLVNIDSSSLTDETAVCVTV